MTHKFNRITPQTCTCSCCTLRDTAGDSAGGDPPSRSATPQPLKPLASTSVPTPRSLPPAPPVKTFDPPLLVGDDGFRSEVSKGFKSSWEGFGEREKGVALSATQELQNQSPSGTEVMSRQWMWHLASHLQESRQKEEEQKRKRVQQSTRHVTYSTIHAFLKGKKAVWRHLFFESRYPFSVEGKYLL